MDIENVHRYIQEYMAIGSSYIWTNGPNSKGNTMTLMHTSLMECCSDCRNAALIARLSDRLSQLALRNIDLENALRNCLEDLEFAHDCSHEKDYTPSIELAKQLLGEQHD